MCLILFNIPISPLKTDLFVSAKTSVLIIRIILLNNNIELVNSDKFSELSSSYFQLGLGKERQKVLFLDDDEDQITITEHILKDAGFSVKSITKSEYILDTLADYKLDLFIAWLILEMQQVTKIVSFVERTIVSFPSNLFFWRLIQL